MIRHRDVRQSRILFAQSRQTQAVGHEVQVPEAQGLAGYKTIYGSWLVDVGELEVFEADAAVGSRAKSKSDVNAGSHRFLLNDRECATVPYLACQPSVFYKLD